MDFCQSTGTKTDEPRWFDPLGEQAWNKSTGKKWQFGDNKDDFVMGSGWQGTGGPEQRERIFSQISAMDPKWQQSTQQLGERLNAVANDQGFTAAAKNARDTINGGYLSGGPEFKGALQQYKAGMDKTGNAIRGRAAAGAADQTANLASNYARVGQGLSTGNQQAAQAGKAAAGARADESVAALENAANQFIASQRIGNYQTERARQAGGASQLEQALGTPLNYLSQIPAAQLAPLQQEAQIIQGMAGGGPIASPNSMVYSKPGIYDYMLSTAGSVMPDSVSL